MEDEESLSLKAISSPFAVLRLSAMALDVLEVQEQCRNAELLKQSQQQQRADVADEFSESHVDTFLKEAVNSRNRITVLRLEQEIERFARNAVQQDFLLKPMQSSYERLAAHRIAQHYGLQSMVVTAVFPKVSRILLVKTVETRLPSIRLADIPVETGLANRPTPAANEKIAIKKRVSKALDMEGLHGSNDSEITPLKSMEEREEEYDRARARIFNISDAANSDNSNSSTAVGVDQQKSIVSSPPSTGSILSIEAKSQLMNCNRIAILRDREKEKKDPDYDRSSMRYPQSLDTNSGVIFPTLHRVYAPTSTYDTYTLIDEQRGHQSHLEQLIYMPALSSRGLRVESCHPDTAYMHCGQTHHEAYWQCPTFPPYAQNTHFNQLKDAFCFSLQNGLQSATTLGAFGL